jgi:hypothetical protein
MHNACSKSPQVSTVFKEGALSEKASGEYERFDHSPTTVDGAAAHFVEERQDGSRDGCVLGEGITSLVPVRRTCVGVRRMHACVPGGPCSMEKDRRIGANFIPPLSTRGQTRHTRPCKNLAFTSRVWVKRTKVPRDQACAKMAAFSGQQQPEFLGCGSVAGAQPR